MDYIPPFKFHKIKAPIDQVFEVLYLKQHLIHYKSNIHLQLSMFNAEKDKEPYESLIIPPLRNNPWYNFWYKNKTLKKRET